MPTPKKPRKNLKPSTTIESQSMERFLMNEKSMSQRNFRDAVTRANGAVPGIKTNALQWNRWTP
jgi:hypothetical protein